MDGYDVLSSLKTGESATVAHCCGGKGIRQRLMDMGLIEGARVDCLHRSPLGDPSAYRIFGAVIALRREDAKGISIIRGESV